MSVKSILLLQRPQPKLHGPREMEHYGTNTGCD
jgi:hypothetical protein